MEKICKTEIIMIKQPKKLTTVVSNVKLKVIGTQYDD